MTGSITGAHPLDAPIWSSLTGAHAHLAVAPAGPPRDDGAGALRYPVDVSPFCALRPASPDPLTGQVPVGFGGYAMRAWNDLATLVGAGASAFVSGPADLADDVPRGWRVPLRLSGVQLVAGDEVAGEPDPRAEVLAEADVDEMLALVRRTEPGPFERRTLLLGTYLGIRERGVLVAMAGERLRPPGHTEISAVCTDPAHRGRGLAGRLVQAVVHGIRERGEIPFLHAAADNTGALRMYEALGFRVRRRPDFLVLRAPGRAD